MALGDWPRRHPVAWRVAAALTAAGLAMGAVLMVALGSCHDDTGFCTAEFGATHVEAYASGAVLAALAAAAVAVTVTRRPARLVLAAAAGAALIVAVAVLGESYG